eukprot:TRINITY_DN3198_c0_g2_i1.p1 TRINITY_DN3198_c0_g2~~TRINITY_DN3198_c0_g2_i1.p1  ORF type:complete len:381 (+),score=60.03 TRINITY_DN3198_c0_g2_i1:85-1143(+)
MAVSRRGVVFSVACALTAYRVTAVRSTKAVNTESSSDDRIQENKTAKIWPDCRTTSGYGSTAPYGSKCLTECWENSDYGPFGWCYTTERHYWGGQWGSCSRTCLDPAQNTKIEDRIPEEGGCSKFALDQWQAPTADSCFLYMYRCAEHPSHIHLYNHNAGDVSWAVTGKCREYGKALMIYKVEVARAWFDHGECQSGGYSILGCKGGYEMCNQQVCGCGLNPASCGEKPDRTGKSVNNFGWRQEPSTLHSLFKPGGWEHCPCYQYSLPRNALGSVKGGKTLDFIFNQTWKDRTQKAYYQYKEYGKAATLDWDKCVKAHVRQANMTTAEVVKNFERLVLKADGSVPECKPKEA